MTTEQSPKGASAPLGQILIIEDEANILEALTFILSRAGWEVRGHGKGGSALSEVARLDPDLLLLDVMLPGQSGFEVLKALRAADDTRDLPVIMLTAKGQARDRERALALGAQAFLTKPFSNDELLDVVSGLRSAIDTHRAARVRTETGARAGNGAEAEAEAGAGG